MLLRKRETTYRDRPLVLVLALSRARRYPDLRVPSKTLRFGFFLSVCACMRTNTARSLHAATRKLLLKMEDVSRLNIMVVQAGEAPPCWCNERALSSKSRRAYIVVGNESPAGRAAHHIPPCRSAARAGLAASCSSSLWADWLLSIDLFAICNYAAPPATTYASVQFKLLQSGTHPVVPSNRPCTFEAPKAGWLLFPSFFFFFFSFMLSSLHVRQHAERTGRFAFAFFFFF